MRDAQLRWFRLDGGAKDHLYRQRGLEDTDLAWCGADLRRAIEAIGSGVRCSLCLRALRAYTDQAIAELPPMVTETLLVQVTRSSAVREDLVALVTRKLTTNRSWQVVVKPYPQEDL